MSESYNEKISTNQNKSEKKEYTFNLFKLLKNLGKVALIGLGVTIASNMIANPTTNPEKIGILDKHIEKVTISAGANIRETPYVADDGENLILTLNDGIDVIVTSGAREKVDISNPNSAEDDWVGIPEKDIIASNPELEGKIDAEIVWINETNTDIVRSDDSEK